ncbi:MAG: hypothetical protein P1U40_00605 [Coxiellaceae bacterium]|nr:hypothetical protein [Coxiellaceae bacterium]
MDQDDKAAFMGLIVAGAGLVSVVALALYCYACCDFDVPEDDAHSVSDVESASVNETPPPSP